MNIIIKSLVLTLGLAVSVNALSAIAVIVNPNNTNEINAKQVRSIYLAKTNTFSDGTKVTPIDVTDDKVVKETFAKEVLRKSLSSLNSYWSRMIFSAKGKPPQALSMSAVKAKVAVDPSSIGYIDSSLVDESVKVVLTID